MDIFDIVLFLQNPRCRFCQRSKQLRDDLIGIEYIACDRTCCRQPERSDLIIKFRPEYTRCIQQIKSFREAHPLFTPGMSRSIRRTRRCRAGKKIDQRRFSHVRNTEDHETHRAALDAAFPPLRQHRLCSLPDQSQQLFLIFTVPDAHGDDRYIFLLIIRDPAIRRLRIRQIRFIQYDDPRLALHQLFHHGVRTRHRNPGVQEFSYDIHCL